MNWTGHSHMKSSETKISYQCEISSETAKNVEVVFQTRIEELSNLGCSVAAFRFLALAAVIAESAHEAEEGYSFRDVCLGPSQSKRAAVPRLHHRETGLCQDALAVRQAP